jgi:hypothetical protein
MQFTPLRILVSQCSTLTQWLEALDAIHPTPAIAQPLFAISGLRSDLQRVYAIEQILMRLESLTASVQPEVFEALSDVLETISLTYQQRGRMALHYSTSTTDQSLQRAISIGRCPTAKGTHP